MRTLIATFTSLLAVPLCAVALTAAPAAAVTASRSEASAARAASSAPVRIRVLYPVRVRAGRVTSTTVKLTNNTKTKTQEIFLAVKYPKGATAVRIYVPKNSRYHERCTRERTRALCLLPGLSRGHSYTFYAKAWVSGSARGNLYGYFGGTVLDTSLDTDPRQLLGDVSPELRWIKSKSSIIR
ncbi:hypothetical protein JOL79_26105 [Microbispora sp. RL4-1S]|uniref:DUF11 domain-containing protein n=1 Tax=Microbispora oryzae TaxID=2806554 RepID=A0A941AKJ4_9ACTN|nr:hypothetical protein [Microbispora oryzae]MBP2707261.1 hypothetical protein [Microbispora oryzae]